jgi:hypothetical protein
MSAMGRKRTLGQCPQWDPIGLRQIDPGWKEEGVDDEYDLYLLHIVGLRRRGCTDADAANYLSGIESEQMGMGTHPTAQPRAARTVQAIRSYLETLPDGRLNAKDQER